MKRIDGHKLRAERVAQNVTRDQLAEIMNMSNQTVLRLETNRKTSNLAFFKLCDALNVNPLDFIY